MGELSRHRASRSATTRSRTRATPSTAGASSGTCPTSCPAAATCCSTWARRPTGRSRTCNGGRSTASADWMAVNSEAIHGTRPLDPAVAGRSDEPWVRWTSKGGTAYAIVDAAGSATLPVGDVNRLDLTKAELLGTGPLAARGSRRRRGGRTPTCRRRAGRRQLRAFSTDQPVEAVTATPTDNRSALSSTSTTTVSPSRTSPASSSRASWSPIEDCTSRRNGRAP